MLYKKKYVYIMSKKIDLHIHKYMHNDIQVTFDVYIFLYLISVKTTGENIKPAFIIMSSVLYYSIVLCCINKWDN